MCGQTQYLILNLQFKLMIVSYTGCSVNISHSLSLSNPLSFSYSRKTEKCPKLLTLDKVQLRFLIQRKSVYIAWRYVDELSFVK